MPNAVDLEDDDDLTPAVAGRGDRKVQRLVDILAVLLSRRTAASFDELAQEVPGYLAQWEACRFRETAAQETAYQSLKRAFERDKDEMRSLGVPIDTTLSVDDSDDGNQVHLYRLQRSDFYLPYLALVAPSGKTIQPDRVPLEAYNALRDLTFEPDELSAVVHAAQSIRSLGDTVLRADVESALRKLAVDLPIDDAADSLDVPRVVTERVQPDREIFDALSLALQRRKAVQFEYRSMHADRTAVRAVDPYGLFFSSGHWYLVARDREQDALRNFRLNRMRGVAQLDNKNAKEDFTVPANFSLRAHARTRQSWELGDDAAMDVVASFDGTSGQTVAAAALGTAVEGQPTYRRFSVRRPDTFVRWVLSFAGEVRIVEPASLNAELVTVAQAARALYDADEVLTAAEPSKAATIQRGTRPWNARNASEKLKRILHVLPEIADGEEHSLADVASRVGCDVKTVMSDLHSLAARVDEPAGFVEKFRISITADTVSAESQHLRRPMRLTMSELCALHLGLAVLRTVRPPDERPVLQRARTRLEGVFGKMRDPIPDSLYAVSLGEEGSIEVLSEVRDATRMRRKIRIGYRKSGSSLTEQRDVCPYTLLTWRGMMYLIAYCEKRDGFRIFRMDRVSDVEMLEETFTVPAFDVEQIARDGRVFMGGDHDTMRVRYSPKIARWIAEREQRELAADGSLVLDHPLADVEWAVRHVLQYGPEAEVLTPASLRVRMRVTLDAMLG